MTVAINDLGRVFMFPRGVNNCNVRPVYGDCFAVDGMTQDNGDVTRVECPDPRQYGKFNEVAVIRGEKGRLTTTLNKRMIMEEISLFRKLFDDDCALDMHIHWGQCTDPTAFNQYKRAWVLENVIVTNWATDTTLAFQSSDRAPVNESIDISAGNFYDILATLTYSQRASAITTTPLVDVVICDAKGCSGDACPGSTGCGKIYALGDNCTIYVSIDGGATWAARVIPVGECPVDTVEFGMACIGQYLVIAYADGSLVFVSRDEIDLGGTITYTMQEEVLAAAPTAMETVSTIDGDVVLIAVGVNIYELDRSLTLTLVDSQAATTAINDFSSNGSTVVGVGAAGEVIYNRNGIWAPAVVEPTTAALFAVVVKTDKHWLVGGDLGELWCTIDGGCSWSRVLFPDSGVTNVDVTDLCASNNHVLWMVANGKMYRSIDGGSTWVIEPNDSTPGCRLAVASLGTISKLACCSFNANMVVGVGAATGGVLGLILLGGA